MSNKTKRKSTAQLPQSDVDDNYTDDIQQNENKRSNNNVDHHHDVDNGNGMLYRDEEVFDDTIEQHNTAAIQSGNELDESGPQQLELLESQGINKKDIELLRKSGITNLTALAYSTLRILQSIKGISEQKATKLLELASCVYIIIYNIRLNLCNILIQQYTNVCVYYTVNMYLWASVQLKSIIFNAVN